MSELPTLLPCPFCGGTAYIEDERSPFCVTCESCACEGPWAKRAGLAIKLWNQRIPMPYANVIALQTQEAPHA